MLLFDHLQSVETVKSISEVVLQIIMAEPIQLDAMLPTQLICLASWDHVEILVFNKAVIYRYSSFATLLTFKR